jgi:ribosomal protein S18 acetylase RimI-like enzyme
MEGAFVCSSFTNTAAQKLYQAMGFDIVDYDIEFSTA